MVLFYRSDKDNRQGKDQIDSKEREECVIVILTGVYVAIEKPKRLVTDENNGAMRSNCKVDDYRYMYV